MSNQEAKEIQVGDFVNIKNYFGVFTVVAIDYGGMRVAASSNHNPSDRIIAWKDACQLADYQPKTKQDIDSQIKEIINNFDFEKVHKVMQLLDWQWYSSNTEDKIPSYGHLVLQAHSLLQQAVKGLNECKGNYYSTGTGGFNAIAIRCEDGYIVVELQFNIAEGSNRE